MNTATQTPSPQILSEEEAEALLNQFGKLDFEQKKSVSVRASGVAGIRQSQSSLLSDHWSRAKTRLIHSSLPDWAKFSLAGLQFAAFLFYIYGSRVKTTLETRK